MSTTTPNRETSSSTGIVFAKAKSEWVIPQRAKPGRKSSKTAAVAVSNGNKGKGEGVGGIPSSSNSTSTTMNNSNSNSTSGPGSGSRDAQRAFRERKSEYITSLETRIDAFERGEIQRNVALQSAARSLKEENTRLKGDLSRVGRDVEGVLRGLRGEVGRLEGVVRGLRGGLEGWEKRAREAERRVRELEGELEVVGSGASSPGVASMRMEGDEREHEHEHEHEHGEDGLSSGIELAREQARPIISIGGNKTSFAFGTTTTDTSMNSHSHPHPHSDPDLTSDSDSISRQVALDMACGFCEGIESVCVCRIVREGERVAAAAAHNQQQEQSSPSQTIFTPGVHSGIYPAKTASSSSSMMVNPVTKQLTPTYHAEITAAVRSTSILDNLPPVEAAVPLRRRVRAAAGGGMASSRGSEGMGRKAPIFAVSPAVSMGVAGVMDAAALAAPGILYIPPAECSGDPRNCPACKDDEFGREFCESLSKSMCNNEPGHRCENCPGEQGPNRLAQPTAIINKTAATSATTATTTTLAPTRSRSDSDKVSSSPTDIEAEYLDIKCCGNSKLCGTTDVHCADEGEEEEDDRAHVHMHDHDRHVVGPSQDHQRPRTFSNGPGPLPTGTWEEKISQLAPHGHEVDVTLTADEAWKTLKAHPNAKFASLAMLADVVARGTKCFGQPSPPIKSADRPDPFSAVQQVPPKAQPIEATASTGSKRRRFEVHSYAVKEALAVLDAHPGHPLKKRRLSDLRGT